LGSESSTEKHNFGQTGFAWPSVGTGMQRTVLATLALGASLLTSCSSKPSESKPPPPSDPATPSPGELPPVTEMRTSDRCEAVRDLMVDTVVHQTLVGVGYGASEGRGYSVPPTPVVATAPLAEPPKRAAADRDMARTKSAPSMGSSGGGGGPSHYTTTNVQEKNVDEGDLVKTDGKFIYTLRNGELMIAKTWPIKDTKILSRIQFKNLQARELYLEGDKLVVHGQALDAQHPYQYGTTRVAVIDVSDRAAPALVRTFDVDGQNASSRLIDGDLYLVQTGGLAVPPKLYEVAREMAAKIPRADQQTLKPWEIQARIARSMRQSLLDNLSAADVANALPKIHTANSSSAMKCADLYMPQDNMGLGLTALARITLDNQRNDLVGAMVSGGQVYASTESIYVSAPAYVWNQQGSATYQTQIHQFALTKNDGRPTYVASGAVDGQLLNQFSMSEHEGNLRVATTDWNWNGQQGGNHLFVLRANAHHLDTIGAIRGLAKGERIYAGRMFGDKGYLVTFRQTDPLFTLDLSDPRHPKVAGELKINGFSNYIHPMDDNLLLAIGQDADENGRVQGFHMQVFDVSDPANPTRRFHEKLSNWSNYSTSAAQADHHAFTYDPITGTLAVPVAGSTNEGDAFNALVVYNVDPKRGFTLHGRVTHREMAASLFADRCNTNDPWARSGNCEPASRRYMIPQYSQIDRSIVVDKYLLTVGVSGFEIHQLDHLALRAAQVRWPEATAQQASLIVSAD
jgi:Beta propeller domain